MALLSTIALALASGWGATIAAGLPDNVAVLQRACPDYTSYSAARQ